jgi:hypothetical protein
MPSADRTSSIRGITATTYFSEKKEGPLNFELGDDDAASFHKIAAAALHRGLKLPEGTKKGDRKRAALIRDEGALHCELDHEYRDYPVKIGEWVRIFEKERNTVWFH